MGTNEAVIFARLHERYSTPRCKRSEQRSRGALSGSDNTLAGKRNTKREPRKASREHQNGSRGRHQNGHPPRLSHIFPGVLCASLPHFSGGTLCESPTFFRGTCYSNHKTRTVRSPSNAKTSHEQPDSLEIKPEP